MKKSIAILCALFSLSIFADTLSGFKRRFEIVRNQAGEVVAIKDRTLAPKFRLKPFLDRVKREVRDHRQLSQSKNAQYQATLMEFYEMLESEAKTSEEAESIRIVKSSLENLPNVDFDAIIANPKVQDLMNKFELKMKESLSILSLNTIARLDNSQYFFKKQVTYQAVKFALDLAKRIFARVPLLNTASYIVVRVERLVRETRTYHQNMLLHYFQHYTPEQLGMTKKEIDLAASSVYESRISPFNVFEARTARDTWEVYGFRKLYQSVRFGQNRLRNLGPVYDSVGKKLNFAFREVELEGETVIINLLDNKHTFSRKPPVAHYYDHPRKVQTTRTLLRLAQVGLSFIPLSSTLKDLANGFINSFYKQQKITEGALVAHFESTGDLQQAKLIFAQSINPYDQF